MLLTYEWRTNVIADVAFESRFMSVPEAAELLGVGLDTMRLWVEAGEVSAEFSKGGSRMISKEALRSFVRRRHRLVESV